VTSCASRSPARAAASASPASARACASWLRTASTTCCPKCPTHCRKETSGRRWSSQFEVVSDMRHRDARRARGDEQQNATPPRSASTAGASSCPPGSACATPPSTSRRPSW
jgi:hypothetical protein